MAGPRFARARHTPRTRYCRTCVATPARARFWLSAQPRVRVEPRGWSGPAPGFGRERGRGALLSAPSPAAIGGSVATASAADQDLESCLLYTSDAADDLTRVDLGGR